MSGKPSHGLSRTPEYRCWQTMRLRCHEPTHQAYADYGGRGIEVCDRWINSPSQFFADMGPRPSPKHEIDRRDNDKGYSPENCRWVTRSENSRNRRSNVFIEHNGIRSTVAEWSERTGIPSDTLKHRLNSGWSTGKALSTPARSKAPNGQAKHAKAPCVDCGKLCLVSRCIGCSNRSRSKARALITAALTQRADVPTKQNS